MPRDAAALAWMANLGCLELHPHPVRAEDLEHPDELRVDLDPDAGRRVDADRGRRPRRAARSWPTSASWAGRRPRARAASTSTCASIRRWSFTQVRRAALALAREVERRAPDLATSKWWKEERHGVFLDYNQNAKDRTVASAYSVRPKPDARVSAPVTWDELVECRPEDFTLRTMPARFAAVGDRHAGIDASPVLAGGAPGAVGPAGGRRPGRRAVAAALREAGGRAAARPALAKEGRRRSRAAAACPTKPLVEIARAAKKETRSLGLERWKARHPEAAAHLEPADVLVDSMRGRSSTWTRVRVNLEHVPEALRPEQERSIPTTTRGAGSSSRRAKDLGELGGGSDLELVVAAVRRPLVRRASAGRRRRAGSGRPAGGRT